MLVSHSDRTILDTRTLTKGGGDMLTRKQEQDVDLYVSISIVIFYILASIGFATWMGHWGAGFFLFGIIVLITQMVRAINHTVREK